MPSSLTPWPCQQSPLHCHPVQHGLQGIFSQNRLQSQPRLQNHLARVARPQESPLASHDCQHGWTTKLTACNVTWPITPLATTPIGKLANSLLIKPTKSDTALADSLYECLNMDQSTNSYYACLNYPVKSMLIKAIDRGYLKRW
jgi:hypothetical protein